MKPEGDYVTVADASDQLGVNQQRVRALLAGGDLSGRRIGRVWFIDPNSLADYRHVRQPGAGRALASATAWAALLTSFASDATDDVVSAFSIVGERRARIRALRSRDPDDWRWLARRRATVRRYDTRTAYLRRLRSEDDTIPAGVSAGVRHGLAVADEGFDAYIDPSQAARLTEQYRLRPDGGGSVTLRTINLSETEQLAVIHRRALPELVTAVDLCEDRDPRTAAAGRRLLVDLVGAAGPTTA